MAMHAELRCACGIILEQTCAGFVPSQMQSWQEKSCVTTMTRQDPNVALLVGLWFDVCQVSVAPPRHSAADAAGRGFLRAFNLSQFHFHVSASSSKGLASSHFQSISQLV